MNSGEPGSPRSRGPPFQAYQYLTVVPSARRFLIELMPLRRTRIACHPSVEGIFRMSDAEVVRIALFPPRIDLPPRRHFEAGVLHGLQSAGTRFAATTRLQFCASLGGA